MKTLQRATPISYVPRLAILLALAASALVTPQTTHALGIVVNSNADDTLGNLDANATCDLREAITNANNDAATYSDCGPGSGANSITFAADYTITLVGAQLPAVSTTLTITGNGAANTVIRANATAGLAAYRVFEVTGAGNLTLDGLTVANGSCSAGTCSTVTDKGGGILNAGTLNLTNGTISTNVAQQGGGLYNNGGTTTIANSTFLDNSTVKDGGGIHNAGGGSLTVTASTFSGNWSHGSWLGGGIFNDASTLTVSASTFAGNTADSGAAIASFGSAGTGATATVTNSTFTANLGGNNSINVSTFGAASTLTIINSTVANNPHPGIAIVSATLNMTNTVVAGNSSFDCAVILGTMGTAANNLIMVNGSTPFNGCGTPTVTTDPMLNALGDYGGPTQTMPLQMGSPAIDAGTSTGAPSTDQRGVGRPLDGDGNGTLVHDIGATESQYATSTFKSIGSSDGWVLESGENSSVGGSRNSTDTYFRLGDDAADRQYRGILSFGTSSLPNNAEVVSAKLKIKQKALTGGDPFLTLGNIKFDMRKGPFAGAASLQNSDFEAAASLSNAGSISNNPVNGWYTKSLSATARSKISPTGVTQFRLRFATGDNDNATADYLRIHSGNAASGSQPRLMITYYAP